jgi:hypothetical protein
MEKPSSYALWSPVFGWVARIGGAWYVLEVVA